MSTYYTLLTSVGLAKLINAQALGTVVQWSAMAVGDGNGNPTTPTQAQTALVREKYRAQLNQLSIDPANPNYLIAEMIIPATQGGWTVHEVGLFDADGDMVAVANFPMTYKPVLADGSTRDLVIRIIIEVSNAATVQLKIDPAVVLASRQWVMTNYVEKVTLNGGTTNQVLRKKSNNNLDVEWADPLAAVQVIVASREETQTLAAAQTVIDLATVTTEGCAVYIEGVRLLLSQFTRNTATRVTLATSYPAGTKVTVVQNEELAGITTPPQFDNDNSLATTAFVQRALGSLAGYVTYAVNTVLTAADVGKYVYANAPSLTLTLPNVTLLPAGSRIYIQASATATCTVTSVNGSIAGPNGNQVGSPSVVLGNGTASEFISSGTGWLAVGGTGVASLSTNGYQRTPSGLIFQWGSALASAADYLVTFPIAFPVGPVSLVFGQNEGTVSYHNNFLTATGFKYRNAAATYPDQFTWFCIGY